MASKLKENFDSIPEPSNRYLLEHLLGEGVFGDVYCAVDTQASGRKVAVKSQKLDGDGVDYIAREYKVLRDLTEHPNLADFYGIYRRKQEQEVWLVIELCEAGPVTDLVNGLLLKHRRMAEEHIAFVVKETIKALIFLHENNIIHRNVKGNNILLTKDGEIKLVDFSLSNELKNPMSKRHTCLGSPCWMAPEVITGSEGEGYGNRVDVWSLGITAIELGDGKPPYQNMHPSRAMFQIVRNPPPTLYRPSNWSEQYNDFTDECLAKNPEYRPFMVEVIEHPFLGGIPENYYHLNQELKALSQEYSILGKEARLEEVIVSSKTLKCKKQPDQEMFLEDLAALEDLSASTIAEVIRKRFLKKLFHTYNGDILLVINPNEEQDIYNEKFHSKYKFKSRSDNPPHIFGVADNAYQYALHHKTTQQILLTGETGSGKTTNYRHLIDHLLYLGESPNICGSRIQSCVDLISSFIHASTKYNKCSTRGVFRAEITFGRTGKMSGAVFRVHQLEKWRVSSVDMDHGNFHALYYFYDAQLTSNNLEKYFLCADRSHRYLREDSKKPRTNPENNAEMFQKLDSTFKYLDFADDQIETLCQVLGSVLVLGDIRFTPNENNEAQIANETTAENVAKLLGVDSKKFCWALTNYCLISKGSAIRMKNSCDKARCSRDVLANNLYNRLVDYLINVVNFKLSTGRKIFGDKYSVKVTDFYGFESFKSNHLQQFFVNCFNEQLQYLYLKQTFSWETLEMNEEGIPFTPVNYYDNKLTLDQIFKRPEGLMSLIDDASRKGNDGRYIIDNLSNQTNTHIKIVSDREFAIAHYTGKVVYDTKEMPDKNKDFLPPEVIEVLRSSVNPIIKSLFTNKLDKHGNLQSTFEQKVEGGRKRTSADEQSDEQYSQIRKMRTASSTFRGLSLNLLKELSVAASTGSLHFVRCVRSNLENKPFGINEEVAKQQLKALSVFETSKARQRGYSHRISFSEFLRRYKFLAFDFDETVDVCKDNCRLLLVRLKMEGWAIGKSKVLLKYYSEEYLSRLYETKVKKIINIQSIIRSYLVKRKMKKLEKIGESIKNEVSNDPEEQLTEEKAAIIIQHAYKKRATRKKAFEDLDGDTVEFIRYFWKKWKAKTIFQVLLQYRAAKYQDSINLAQQIHLYNQNVVNFLHKIIQEVDLVSIDSRAQISSWIGEAKPTVLKIPFRLDEIPFFDTSFMCDPLTNLSTSTDNEDVWDAPFQRKDTVSSQITTSTQNIELESSTENLFINKLVEITYSRDPSDLPILTDSPEPTINPSKSSDLPSHRPPQSPASSSNTLNNDETTTTSAGKDFEYIKPPQLKKAPNGRVNPISEMKQLGRNESLVSDEDPPFNFQKMLRKTNYVRQSLRRVMDKNEPSLEELDRNRINDDVNRNVYERFSGELAPGVFVEGVVFDL